MDTDADKKGLLTLSEDLLERMEPVATTDKVTDNQKKITDDINSQDTVGTAADDESGLPMTLSQHLENLPIEMRTLLQSGLNDQAAQKVALVKGIKASERNQFSDSDLESMDIPALQNLAAFANVSVPAADYLGQGFSLADEPRGNQAGQVEYTAAPSVLDALKEGNIKH